MINLSREVAKLPEKRTLVLATTVLAILTFPIWRKFTHYPFRTLIPFATVGFLFYELPQLSKIPGKRSQLGLISALVLTFGYLSASITGEQKVVLWWIPPTFWAWMWGLLGWPRARKMLLAMAFLIFLLPTAEIWNPLIPYLKEISTIATAWVLKLCGVSVYRKHEMLVLSGVLIEINDRCAGVGFFSKMTLFALILGVLGNFTSRQRWLLFCSAPILAVSANVIRIVLFSFVAMRRPAPEFMRWWDVVCGAALFFLTAVALAILAGSLPTATNAARR